MDRTTFVRPMSDLFTIAHKKSPRRKVTLSVYHQTGTAYNILGGTASITLQKSEADLFVKEGDIYRTLVSAAATNTTHPAADYEETDVTMLTYRQNNSPEMATTNLEIPHLPRQTTIGL